MIVDQARSLRIVADHHHIGGAKFSAEGECRRYSCDIRIGGQPETPRCRGTLRPNSTSRRLMAR